MIRLHLKSCSRYIKGNPCTGRGELVRGRAPEEFWIRCNVCRGCTSIKKTRIEAMNAWEGKEQMLYQLHWQFKDGHTEMRAQKEFSIKKSHTNPKEMVEWTKDVQKKHPLPEGAEWMMCTEESEFFLLAVA